MTSPKTLALAAALALAALPAAALDASMQLVFTLPDGAQREVVTYQCEGQEAPLTVTYINAHPNFLALVPVDGETRVFANVIAASGARYAAGEYVWWSRGNDAALYDETQDGDAPLFECHAAQDIP